jgi:transcriptional regulator with XRE-family HTH domain
MNSLSASTLKKTLKRIPGYYDLVADRAGVSRITVYRVLRGTSSRNTIKVLETAAEVVKDYQVKLNSLINQK